ncbi:MAG: FkbM family methyltransferase [Thermodesulfobacteriota bacterium]|nr:FkbM family methyltransferase [Thermodesulfobacteriota bacterium]
MLESILREAGYDLSFTILEIGALPMGEEPFHKLLKEYPSSRILAFEVDPVLCAELNGKATRGIHFYPYALGKTEEEKTFYDTRHPMCSSLYKPNEALIDMFQNLEVAKLKQTFSVQTVSMDHFADINKIGPVDFIKIDIQGAELDVFEGGKKVLKDVLVIVSEVEFVPIYEKQSLFGDVSAFLWDHGLIFHKFLGLAGRSVKPIVFKNNLNYPSQHLWSDAVFIRDFLKPDLLDDLQLLKTAILMNCPLQ